jgi:hypothetical protein
MATMCVGIDHAIHHDWAALYARVHQRALSFTSPGSSIRMLFAPIAATLAKHAKFFMASVEELDLPIPPQRVNHRI